MVYKLGICVLKFCLYPLNKDKNVHIYEVREVKIKNATENNERKDDISLLEMKLSVTVSESPKSLGIEILYIKKDSAKYLFSVDFRG